VYVDDVMTMQPIRKWQRVFENDQMNIHDDDESNGLPSPSGADVMSEPVEELVLKH
jgi:hypothetical protein